MRTVGVFEAKTHLAELLRDVGKGETFTITRRGEPIAVLSPVVAAKPSRREALFAIEEIRRDIGAASVDEIRTWIDEGRQ